MRATKFTEATCHAPSKQLARDMVLKHQMDYVNSFDKSSPQLFTVPCLPWLEATNELKLAKRFGKIKQHIFHIQAKENDYATWAEMIERFKDGKHWIQKFSKRAKYENGVFFASKGNVQIQLEFDDWTWEDVTNNPMVAWGDFCGMPTNRVTEDFITNIKQRRSYALTFYLNPRNLRYVDHRLYNRGYLKHHYGAKQKHDIVKDFLHEAVSETRLIKKIDDIFYWNGDSPMGTYYIETN